MKIGQFNMRHSPMVGDLLQSYLQNGHYDVVLLQDPPRNLLMKTCVSQYQLFCSEGLNSLTAILVVDSRQASLHPGGSSRACVVRVWND